MGIVILIVIAHVDFGQSIKFQEFNSLRQCNYAAKLVLERSNERKHSSGIESAFCVYK